jgi:CRP/FNR family transcriptional regulator, cyclic AMP receptor protein
MQVESLARSLAEHAFTAGMAAAELEFLAGCTKNLRFEPGGWLFREGSAADTLFLIRSGRVALESHAPGRGAVKVETCGTGDTLGWSALFEPYVWHLDGRAIDATLTFAVDGRCLRDKMEREPAFGYAITRRLLFQVHKRLERARLQQLDVYKAEL